MGKICFGVVHENCCVGNSVTGVCCCQCRWHVEMHFHCSHHRALRDSLVERVDESCICDLVKGYACMPPEFNEGREERGQRTIAFADWPLHSPGCEMFEQRGPSDENEEQRGTRMVSHANEDQCEDIPWLVSKEEEWW